MTYRTNTVVDKPISSFNSTTSLGPLQSTLVTGPGQKLAQQQSNQAFIKHSKSNVSIDNCMRGNQTQKLNLNGLAASTTANIIAAAKPSTAEPTTLTLKLNPVEESKSDEKHT